MADPTGREAKRRSKTIPASAPVTRTTDDAGRVAAPAPSRPPSTREHRVARFWEAINSERISLEQIRTLSFHGIPEDPGIRSVYWKILLNYLPLSRDEWTAALERSRAQYAEFQKEFFFDPHARETKSDHPLSQERGSAWDEFHLNRAIEKEIRKDIERTCPQLSFYQNVGPNGEVHYEAVFRILFVYAKLNPGIGYVQGMNELVAVFYYVFYFDPDSLFKGHHEADTFFCFTHLMAEIRDNFCKVLDASQSGVISDIQHVSKMIQDNDPELWEDLESKGLDTRFYSFRWVTLLLSQEFDFPDVLRLWDSLFSDASRFSFLYHFCSAMVITVRDRLLSEEFAENLKLLQDYPSTIDFSKIFRTAVEIRDGVFESPAPRPAKSEAKLRNRVSSSVGAVASVVKSTIRNAMSK